MLTVRIPTDILADGTYRITSSMLAVHGNVNYSLKADAVELRVRRQGQSAEEPGSSLLLPTDVSWEIERIAVSS